LASHCAAFISISYFDQIQVFWFWLWAVIAILPTVPAIALNENSLSEQELQAAPAAVAKGETPIGGQEPHPA